MKERIIRYMIWLTIIVIAGYFLLTNVDLVSIDRQYQRAMQSDRPVIIYTYSEKCIYCKTVTPIVNSMKNKYEGQIDFVIIDIEKNMGYIPVLNIQGVPHFTIMLKTKQIVFQNSYVPSYQELDELCNQLLNPVLLPQEGE